MFIALDAKQTAHAGRGAVGADQQTRVESFTPVFALNLDLAHASVICRLAQSNQARLRIAGEMDEFAQPRFQRIAQIVRRDHAAELFAAVFAGIHSHRTEIAATTDVDTPDRRRLRCQMPQHAERLQRIQAGSGQREIATIAVGHGGKARRLGFHQCNVQAAALQRASQTGTDQAAADHQHIVDLVRPHASAGLRGCAMLTACKRSTRCIAKIT